MLNRRFPGVGASMTALGFVLRVCSTTTLTISGATAAWLLGRGGRAERP